MIDIHCHILPHLDDGAQTFEESYNMAKQAINEGITAIIATPHYQEKYRNDKQKIVRETYNLNERLQAEDFPLSIHPGQEVRIFGEVLQEWQEGKIQTLADTNYMFIEFPSNHVPKYTEKLFYDMQLEGLIPIIVHPERNQQLIEQPELLYFLVKKGALTQVTAGSLVGHFGKNVKKFTQQIIEANLTHFIASDAHNTTTRPFHFNKAIDTLDKLYGTDIVYLFTENAELLLNGENVMKEMPEKIKRKRVFGLF
ncbi:tyrosine-protein phosphatase [Cytobacillus sp. FSL R7-0680]|uniref:tyrosine-protein phosphatase n=1 Tax=Cytobacillus sp. FSL R7-0680 TaxID=2921689 RepID=UPI0030FA2412